MKRRHVSVAVRCWKIRSSTSRYSATVDAEESTISVSKPSNDAELALVAERLTEARQTISEQKATSALSNEAWVHGPEGIAWEIFQTSRESTGLWRGSQGERSIGRSAAKPLACCTPSSEATEGITNG
jgi:hypothetical protein